VTLSMLPDTLSDSAVEVVAGATPVQGDDLPLDGLIGKTFADIERAVVLATLDSCGGSVPKAARMLDIAPSTLYRKLEGWGVDRQSA
jgi:two-component system, repressor protein LuxO